MKKIKIILTILIISSAVFLTSCKKQVVEEEHVHSWEEWEILNPATCTAEGLKGRDCKECPQYEREAIAKLEHEYDEGQIIVEPGCTTTGVKILACVHCKDIQTETIPQTGHKFVEGLCTNCGTREQELKNLVITFEANGGTLDKVTATYLEGTQINLPVPNKDNYLFAGWFTTSTFEASSKLATKVVITEDMTVYAKWVLEGYSVTLDANGGYVNNSEIVLKDNQVFTIEVPVTNEYVFFTGWYLGSQQITDEFGNGLKPWNITEDVELTAKWDKEKEENGIKYLYQGEYPQSLVTNVSLISELTKLTTTNERGYFEYNGSQYTKVVYKAEKTNSLFNNGEKLEDGKTYYFRVDPILWRILDEKKGIVITNIILDSLSYYENAKANIDYTSVLPNNYEYSDISGWLNGEVKFKNNNFATKAFKEPLDIVQMIDKLDNSAPTTGKDDNTYACNNFTTFFYLLSYVEYTDTYSKLLNGGKCGVSDYAIARGIRADNYSMNGEWWLRSPSSDALGKALAVSTYGVVFDSMVSDTNIGVRPAAIFKDLIKKGETANEKK